MDETFELKIQKLRNLLFECYDHLDKRACDGVEGKSQDGCVTITYPGWFHTRSRHQNDKKPVIEVYSYVFCDGRRDYFNDVDEAIAHVQKWHDYEFSLTEYGCWVCEDDDEESNQASRNVGNPDGVKRRNVGNKNG